MRRASDQPARSFGTALASTSLLLAMLTACGGVASPSQGASGSAPEPTVEPTGSPTPAESPTPGPSTTPQPPLFQNQGAATVKVNGLNVRVEPSVSAPRQTDAAGGTITLNAGDEVFVLGGPVWADDRWWFTAGLPQNSGLYAAPIPVGWVAGGTLEDPWIEAARGFCPDVSVTSLAELQEIKRITCFSSSPITFDARIASLSPDAGLGGACDIPDDHPTWLMCENINYNWVNADGGTDWLLKLHFDPATDIEPTGLAEVGATGAPIRVTGHFDDPAATECVTAADASSLDGLSQWLTCASRFVVESIQYR